MARKGLWIAASVVIVSNVFALGSSALNRRGVPDAVLELTERELRLPQREAENTAMTLRLAWADPAKDDLTAGWFDAAKLASIGFDCGVPVTRENAAHYRALPPRATYAVLEFDGQAWQRYVDALPATADKELALARPRLILVDIGNDPGALRARYPDRRRTVIVPATAGLAFVQDGTRQPFLKGRINMVYPAELSVPRELRPVLDSMPARRVSSFDRRTGQADPMGEPRYRVTVKWGRSLEPWIESVEAINAKR